jgi:hypothetical protein
MPGIANLRMAPRSLEEILPRSTLVAGADLSRRRRSLDGVNGSMMLY